MILPRFAEGAMKRFVEGADRGQSTLFPECLEDWICEDNGGNSLSDEAPTEGRDRDGLARARLQSHARHEYHRRSTAPGGDEGIALRCAAGSAQMHPSGPGADPRPGNVQARRNGPKS